MISNLLMTLVVATLALASPLRRWDPPSPALSLTQWEQEVFDVSMQINDWSWEPSTGWIEADDDNVRGGMGRADKVGSHELSVHRVVHCWVVASQPGERRCKRDPGYTQCVGE